MRRRALLAVLASTTAAGVAGCLGGPAPGAVPETDSPRPDSTTATPSPTATPTHTRSEPSAMPVRCRGEPVAVERSVTDEPGYDDDIEYFPDNETVRFVTIRSGDEPLEFDTWSFEEWGAIECAEVGLERVREVTADRLETDEFGSSIGQPPEFFSSDSLVIWLEVATQVEDGETVNTPTVPLARLADVAPRSVNATVSIKGDTFSRTVPVFAEHVEMGLA